MSKALRNSLQQASRLFSLATLKVRFPEMKMPSDTGQRERNELWTDSCYNSCNNDVLKGCGIGELTVALKREQKTLNMWYSLFLQQIDKKKLLVYRFSQTVISLRKSRRTSQSQQRGGKVRKIMQIRQACTKYEPQK